jgi:hypothetical protein
VLGQDFAAPMGVELREAIEVGKVPLAFRRRTSHSPSSQDTMRRLDHWHVFTTATEFRPLFTRVLIHAVVRQATQLGLGLEELERLLELVQTDDERATETGAEGRRRAEAGRSGVILGREIWETER